MAAHNTKKSLRYLWVYSAADDWTEAWHQRLLQQRRERGFDIEGFCITPTEFDRKFFPFPRLDALWKAGDRALLQVYERLAETLRGKDVMIHYNGSNLHPEFVRWLNVLKVYTAGDDPESTEILTKPAAPASDIHLVNNIACLDMYREWGLPHVYFWPLGSLNTEQDVADITEEHIRDLSTRTNPLVLFCEREMRRRRSRLDKLSEAFPDAYFGGRGWPRGFVSWEEMWSTYRKTRIGWNLHNSSGPINFRTYELPAFGIMQICDNKANLGKIYELGREAVGYDTIEECIHLTRYYLAHPEEQREIAVRGWKRWKKDYTPDRVWDRLVEIVEKHWPADLKKEETQDISLQLRTRMAAPASPQTRPLYRRIAGRIRRKLLPQSRKVDQTDLAGKQHWDMTYGPASVSPKFARWEPGSYDMQTLGHALSREMEQCRAKTMLEVGCGGSVWLGYLGRKHNVEVTGVDYSGNGCQLARARLRAENVNGRVICMDIFKATPEELGTFDFVYSLGVAEHFTDLDGILSHLLKFVKPGGILFTEVPNLKSIHGILSWIWQPELLAKHKIVTKQDLLGSYKRLRLTEVRGYHMGLFSLGIVAWEYYQRWPRLARWVVPCVHCFQRTISCVLMKLGKYSGFPFFAPFICVVGKNPSTGENRK